MKKSRYYFREWADRIGMCASVLCVCHCLLAPVLLLYFAVMAHSLPTEERVHRTMAVLVALLGASAFAVGFPKHRRPVVFILMAAGLGAIVAGAWFGDRLPSHTWELGITMLGSGLMIAAHLLNHIHCEQCRCSPMGKRKAASG